MEGGRGGGWLSANIFATDGIMRVRWMNDSVFTGSFLHSASRSLSVSRRVGNIYHWRIGPLDLQQRTSGRARSSWRLRGARDDGLSSPRVFRGDDDPNRRTTTQKLVLPRSSVSNTYKRERALRRSCAGVRVCFSSPFHSFQPLRSEFRCVSPPFIYLTPPGIFD